MKSHTVRNEVVCIERYILCALCTWQYYNDLMGYMIFEFKFWQDNLLQKMLHLTVKHATENSAIAHHLLFT